MLKHYIFSLAANLPQRGHSLASDQGTPSDKSESQFQDVCTRQEIFTSSDPSPKIDLRIRLEKRVMIVSTTAKASDEIEIVCKEAAVAKKVRVIKRKVQEMFPPKKCF